MTEKEICEFTKYGTEQAFKKRSLVTNIRYYLNNTGYQLKKITTHNYILEKSPELIEFENIVEVEGYPKLWHPLNLENLSGQQFGRLLVLYRTIPPSTAKTSQNAFWLCQCQQDGNYTISSTNSLKSGGSTSCGCLRTEHMAATKIKNSDEKYIGKKFNHLTVLERVLDEQGKATNKFLCQCDCDNKTLVQVISNNLVRGHTTSCGCEKHKKKDLTNQIFGHLTALKCVGINEKRQAVWQCQCDCKNHTIINVIGIYLTLGYTTSCGCARNISKGETKIAEILKNNNIEFITQKTFNSCRLTSTGFPLKFDFYIPGKNLCIEFDGKQHFEPVDFFGGEIEHLKTKERDKFKNQWCKNNNILLIRIPYTHFDKISLEDLLPETTQFKV